MTVLISVAVFITLVMLIEGIYVVVRSVARPAQHRIHHLSRRPAQRPQVDIVRQQRLSHIPWLHTLLSNVPLVSHLVRLLQQSNVDYLPGRFLMWMALGCGLGYVVGSWMSRHLLAGVLGAGCAGVVPLLYLLVKKRQRAAKFQRQLPDALDMLARSLRAGHAFMTGMKMIGDEFPDPLGTEFDRTVDEINFGVAAPEALQHLSQRIECQELHFFVTAVILQREAGGDLAEVIEKIARLIRKRFELQGRIRTLSAEGKLSAVVLVALPFFIVLAISFTNPAYLTPLFEDPIGHAMIGLSSSIMLLGILVITKMVNIKV